MITENLAEIRQQVAHAAQNADRAASSVNLVAVSKTKPIELIEEAYTAGQRIFGENRLQELEVKAPALPDDCEWHFIGTAQRNKARKILTHADVIHSIDSMRLLETISRIAGEIEKTASIFLQIHIGGESTKQGFSEVEIFTAFPTILELPHLEIRGLMCIPPPAESDEEAREYFRKLSEIQTSLNETFHQSMDQLSMGMSSDFAIAIAEGATHVRVGTSIFGSR